MFINLTKEKTYIVPNFIDRTGQVFGELTVLLCTQKACRKPIEQKTKWLCECSCGNIAEYQGNNLTSGNSTCCTKCRTAKAVKHGFAKREVSKESTYNSWQSMKQRCNNANCDHYGNYGGRGITYDSSWEDFQKFYEDMGDCPEGLSLERIDVNLGYFKENCKWASRSEQSYNRRKDSKNTSGIEGVFYRKDTGKWTAYINKDNFRTTLGCFETKEDAIIARRNAEIELYGKIKEN
jgi:hypothetical protein